MSDIVEVLNEIVERHDCSHPAIVSKASAEITRLTAENEKLGRDYQSARDAHDKVLAENERLRAALEGIRARRYQNRETVSPDTAFERWRMINAEFCAIFDECDATLSGDKQ
jgi:hypothetical protein